MISEKQLMATKIATPTNILGCVSRAQGHRSTFKENAMSHESLNPWMLATIGILLVGTTVGVTMLAGRESKIEAPESKTAQISETKAQVTQNVGSANVIRVKNQRTTLQPAQSIIATCNEYADDQVNSKTEDVLTSTVLGAAIGAAVGAAGGAIAGGGNAGKGAAIGGLTGAAGGSLYGLNESKSHDARYQAAYSSCMRSKGYRR